MYPSDYGYAIGGNVRNTCLKANLYNYNTNNCMSNDWLWSNHYEWTITPITIQIDANVTLCNLGLINSMYDYQMFDIRPVVYLKSSVKITGGIGSSSSPYTLSL